MFRILQLIFIYFILIIIVQPVFAEEKKIIYDVQELVNLAMKRSELLNASEKSVESAKWLKDQTGAWQNPSLAFGAGNKSTSDGKSFVYDASITQPFYFPGKQKIAGDIAGIQEKIAGLDRDDSRLFVQYSVIRLSYQYAVASELLKHLEERSVRYKKIRKYLTSRPFASPQKRMEKHIVEMKLMLIQKNLDEIRSGKDIIWAKLNLFLDLEDTVAVKAPWFIAGITFDWNKLLSLVESGNIDLKKQLLVLDRAKAETSLANKFIYPDFSLSLIYQEDRVVKPERFLGAGVSVNVPIWNTNKSGVKSLESAVDAEKSLTLFRKREIIQVLKSSFIDYETVKKNLERLPVSVIKDIDVDLADADDSFDKGFIDFVTYSEVESQTSDMHFAVLNAQYEYVDKYAVLLILQGSEDFAFNSTIGKNK